MKRCSTSPVNRKCKSKSQWNITSPVRMAIIKRQKKKKQKQVLGGCGRGKTQAMLVRIWIGTAPLENEYREFLKS